MKFRILTRISFLVVFIFFILSCDNDITISQIGSLYLIEVMPPELIIEIDSTYQFSAVGRDVDLNAINDLTFSWISRYPQVGTIDQNGLFTAHSTGITYLTAKSGPVISPQATITVIDSVFSIEILQDLLIVVIDSTTQFTAIGKDMNGDDIAGLSFIWETGNASIATIDNYGFVTGIGVGTTTVTASLRDNVSMPALIIVQDSTSKTSVPLYLIEIMPPELIIEIDSIYQFSAVGRDVNLNAINDLTFSWISHYPQVGTIDQNGLFTAHSTGITYLTAKSGTVISPQTTVNVYDPVFSIEIMPDSLSVPIDSTDQFTAVGKDMNGDDILGLSFIWESWNTGIAIIDNDGFVTGVAAGTTAVTATYDDKVSLPAVLIVVEETFGTVTDIDGNVYQTVKIGDQWWMAENLKVTHYRNGDAIPYITNDSLWYNRTTGAYCSYDNDTANVENYGMLYNGFAANDSRNIAPEGWHLPSDNNWMELEMYLGMSQSEAHSYGLRGTDEGSKLKSGTGWQNNGNGTDEYSFSALPGGHRYYFGEFIGLGSYAYFWSPMGSTGYDAWHRRLQYNESGVIRNTHSPKLGFSIRCVRD